MCLDAEPLAPVPVPEIPEFTDDAWRVVPEFGWTVDCSAAHLIENNVDPAHIAFVAQEQLRHAEEREGRRGRDRPHAVRPRDPHRRAGGGPAG